MEEAGRPEYYRLRLRQPLNNQFNDLFLYLQDVTRRHYCYLSPKIADWEFRRHRELGTLDVRFSWQIISEICYPAKMGDVL